MEKIYFNGNYFDSSTFWFIIIKWIRCVFSLSRFLSFFLFFTLSRAFLFFVPILKNKQTSVWENKHQALLALHNIRMLVCVPHFYVPCLVEEVAHNEVQQSVCSMQGRKKRKNSRCIFFAWATLSRFVWLRLQRKCSPRIAASKCMQMQDKNSKSPKGAYAKG